MLMIVIASSSQIVSLTPDFLLPVDASWKSFRWLPDAADASNSFLCSDHQSSRSLRKLCPIPLRNGLRLWSNSQLPRVDTKKYCGTSVPECNPEFKTPAPPTTPRSRSQRSTSQPRSQKSHQHCPMSAASPRLSTPTRKNQRFSLHSNEVSNTLKSELADSISASPGPGMLSELKQNSSLLRPLVIILTEIESIPVQVLCDFIELTSLYVAGQIRGRSYSLPITFVFGLSTIPEIGFEPRFSASILSRLTIRRFSVPSPSAFLNVVLKEVSLLSLFSLFLR
ncbi:unnamed protein product [Schistosoma margrebowiei]|uniref:Origin recognition complex subunit 3 N-terminal domain-containing protein n=1 Tax=Schistosoma margrebowiei TaxID=48269 RepID=A0A183N9J6_9TREM|nr:unnamed protein product [Schistosoma margrebowiei]